MGQPDLRGLFVELIKQTVHFSVMDLPEDLIVSYQALCLSYVQASGFGARDDVNLPRNSLVSLFC